MQLAEVTMSIVKSLGKILWWSNRDENGVLLDSKGNEYYFDRSVLNFNEQSHLYKGTLVLFIPGRIDGVLTARSISLPRSTSVKKYNEQFINDSLQLSFGETN